MQKQLERLAEQNQSTERHTSSVAQQVSEHQAAVSDLKGELKLCLKRLESALKERGLLGGLSCPHLHHR
jgi:hypothetical protein